MASDRATSVFVISAREQSGVRSLTCASRARTSATAAGRYPGPGTASTFFRGGDRPGYSWSVVVKDVLDAEVLEVIAWAQSEIGDEGLFAVALVGDHDGERGLVWLVGMDANDDPSNETERALRAAMEARRGHTVVRLPSEDA